MDEVVLQKGPSKEDYEEPARQALGGEETPAPETPPLGEGEKEEIVVVKRSAQRSLFGAESDTLPDKLDEVEKIALKCTKCPALVENRTQVVFGVGNPHARLMFVGEAPGRDEDIQGIPFVGRAGKMLTNIIKAMRMTREEVYIANILKCRPPDNRNPLPEEMMNCTPYLEKQIELIRPAVIVALGAVAAHALLETSDAMGKLRGKFYQYKGITMMVTYHPAYLLRNPNDKRKVWDDMKKVMQLLAE
jgi:DNA polymerase